jgi:hypothetical protein
MKSLLVLLSVLVATGAHASTTTFDCHGKPEDFPKWDLVLKGEFKAVGSNYLLQNVNYVFTNNYHQDPKPAEYMIGSITGYITPENEIYMPVNSVVFDVKPLM